MANKPSKIKINVKKINKAYIYRGQKADYLDIAVWENRDGPDEYGNTHYLVQELPKEARDRGEKGAIIGNMRLTDDSGEGEIDF